jgi:hypothetical protein
MGKGILESECRVTHEALIRVSEHADLQSLRELVRNIESEDEPAHLDALLEQLRGLVGLPQVDVSPRTGNLATSSAAKPAEK